MILNQQLTGKQYNDFIKFFDFTSVYFTDYEEMKAEGWHKEHKESNKYVKRRTKEEGFESYKEVYKNYKDKDKLLEHVKVKFLEY